MKVLKFAVILILLSVFSAGCKKEDNAAGRDEFLIVASFYPVYVIALNVADGVNGARVVNMTPPVTGCLHDYSVTAGDMKNLENADIFLFNGAGMESFLDKIAGKYPGLKTAELSKGISLIKSSEGENPHVWVSVGNAVVMAENCVKALSEADPGNAGSYKANGAVYIKDLQRLKSEMNSELMKFSGRKIITFHEAFPYFAKEFNFDIAAVIEREPGSEPSAKELAETINLVRSAKIKTLFAEPQYPLSSANVIAKETGAKVFVLDPAVTGENDKGAYIKIMKKNLSVLASAFSEK
ncbi:MAG TPA: metal ABC transporter substrate-binding protein [Spirochaetota bacterium]|nr:metal ABC transporter substrate-binding protein [Spirochaetota bacterium]HPS85678.1 metal ABC transporter substrate-binding protein [Spirochaetota bacterium]